MRPRFEQMSDERRDTHALLLAMTGILVVYFIGTAAHNAIYYGLSTSGPNPGGARAAANAVATAVMLMLTWLLRVPQQRTWLGAVPRLALIAAISSVTRWGMQQLFEVETYLHLGVWAAELSLGFLYLFGAGILGFAYMRGRRTVREEERELAEQQVQRELALSSLGDEEVRVRRGVAEGLHGGMQQRLVIQVARLDLVIARARENGAPEQDIEQLLELRSDLDRIREYDVREMSRLLFPEGLEIGMVPAVRSMLRRLPPGIAARMLVSDEIREIDDPATSRIKEAERLLAVRVVEEAITNALKHGHATAIEVWIGLRSHDCAVVIDVLNNGAPVDDDQGKSESGMSRLGARARLGGGGMRFGNLRDLRPLGERPPESAAGDMTVLVSMWMPLRNRPGRLPGEA